MTSEKNMQTDLYPATGSIHNGFKCHHDVGKILLTCVQNDSYVSTANNQSGQVF